MDQNKEIEDDFLGRWLVGELTDEELKHFKQSSEYGKYEAIARKTEQLQMPVFDKTKAFESLKARREAKETKVIRLSSIAKWGIAASIAVLLGTTIFYVFFNSTNVLETREVLTAQGEETSIILPDQSTVDLNVASKLEYDESRWKKSRKISLEGEAYFDVQEGPPFQVSTSHGVIEVLGTSFNVRNRQSRTEVMCYSGKVRVNDLHGNQQVLTPGNWTVIEGGTLKEMQAKEADAGVSWKNGESTFEATSLSIVVEELENVYGIDLEMDHEHDERLYTGVFPHDHLKQALDMICNPLDLKYTIQDDGHVVID